MSLPNESAAGPSIPNLKPTAMPSTAKSPLPSTSTPNSTSTPIPTPLPPLARISSNRSIHAQNALRRMATHDGGLHAHHEGEDQDQDHDHHEDDDHSGPSSSETIRVETDTGRGGQGGKGDVDLEKGHCPSSLPGEEGGGGKGKKKQVELQDQTNLLPTKQVIFVFIGLTCGFFCSLLDQTIVTTALPTLGKVFNRADISSWVGTSYLLTSTALQPIYGRLSDIFGRKFVLLGSLGFFLLGSLACSLAQSMIQLIVFRAIQGIGGGGILTLGMIIISDVVSLKERGKYQGLIGGVVALSNSLGPILGGIFTEKASWRWCFYINLPLTSLAIVVIIFLLPLKRVKGSISAKLRKLDWYGSVLTLAWAILVLLALSWAGSQYSWTSAAVLAPLIIGIFLLGLFIWVEKKVVPLPLIPFHIFSDRTVTAAMVTTIFNGSVFYATLYYLPQCFQVVWGASAIRSGILLLPLVLTQTVCSFSSGILQSKTGDYWWNLVIGFSIWTIGLGLLSSIGPHTSVAKLTIYQIIDGIGAGQTFQTSLVAIQAAVPRREMATATGMRNFTRMLGGTLALTICSVIVNNVVRSRLGSGGFDVGMVDGVLSDPTGLVALGLTAVEREAVIDAYSRGINAIFYFLVPQTAISTILTIFFIKKIPLNRKDDAAKKEESKQWLEARKERHRKHPKGEGEGEEREERRGSEVTIAGGGEQPANEVGGVKEIERGVEDAGRGMEEAGAMEGKEGKEAIGTGENGDGR